jgi:hypothetical protein
MAKKPTKKELKQQAESTINWMLQSGTPELITADTLLAALPGGASGEALIFACQSLRSSPGMRMDALQEDACAQAGLNFSTAAWIVGEFWGSKKHFGSMDLLWERRKEKHSGDKRAVWHYYLLPAGQTLAAVSAKENTYRTNMERIESGSYAKPGGLLMGRWEPHGYCYWSSEYKQVYLRDRDEPETAFIATTYLGLVRGWDPTGAHRIWKLIEATGPDDPSWQEVMTARQVFLGCIGPDGVRVAISITEAKALKS